MFDVVLLGHIQWGLQVCSGLTAFDPANAWCCMAQKSGGQIAEQLACHAKRALDRAQLEAPAT